LKITALTALTAVTIAIGLTALEVDARHRIALARGARLDLTIARGTSVIAVAIVQVDPHLTTVAFEASLKIDSELGGPWGVKAVGVFNAIEPSRRLLRQHST
jgi:hypothetical protein